MIAALLKTPAVNGGDPSTTGDPAVPALPDIDRPFARLSEGGTLRFGFEYYGIPFEGEVRHVNGGAAIGIRGNLGPIPYSAESVTARREVLSVLAAARDFPYGRFTTTPDKCILLDADLAAETPVTPDRLLSGVTSILLSATPLISRLATLVPPAARTPSHSARGTMKT